MKTENHQFSNTINSEEELRALIGVPSELVNNKVISQLDDHCLDFISKSPFVVMSTSDNQGLCDVSPRGDHAGFVHIIDKKTLIIPERPGNKRIDSMRNILTNPYVGLIFIIPGLGETLEKSFLTVKKGGKLFPSLVLRMAVSQKKEDSV